MKFALIAMMISMSALAQAPAVRTVADITNNPQAKSRQGRDLPIITLGPEHAAKRIYLQAALHGNETATTSFVLWMVKRWISRNSALNQLGPIAVDIVPIANPDGYVRRQRTNLDLVNLNRNFPVLWGISREFPGNAPLSEPESRAIRALFQQRQYAAAVDIHGFINWVVTPSIDPGRKRTTQQMQDFLKLRAAATSAMNQFDSSYQLKSAGALGDGGSFEDWAFWEMGVPTICFELDQALADEQRYLQYEQFITDYLRALFASDVATHSSSPRSIQGS